MTERADTMLADLKRAGLKLTPQRIAIVRELAGDLSHPTAQALFERLRPAYPTMSFATVYSTLDVLVERGLIASARSLDPDQGARAVRFDPNVEPHHHAICDACGSVVDIPLDALDSLETATPRLEGFRVLREERTYRGLCDKCTAGT